MQIRELPIPKVGEKVTYTIGIHGVEQVENQAARAQQATEKWDGCRIRMGAVNSIQLSKNNKFKDMLEDNAFLDMCLPLSKDLFQDTSKLKCNCKRSKCLKLYCECFSKKIFCGLECECNNCANSEVNAVRLNVLREEMPARKSNVGKGCRCQKSSCQKKYCQCFQKGEKCTSQCQCNDCLNCQVTEPIVNYQEV